MADHRARRRPGFREGFEVVLADGEPWTLPVPDGPDPEFDALLRAIAESEGPDEALRLELALTILLLGRNYELGPDRIARALDFPEGDPALDRLRGEVRGFVARSIGRDGPPSGRYPRPLGGLGPSPA